jgi:hypothetical protein
MDLKQLREEAIKILKVHPELKPEIQDLFSMAISEVQDGGSESNECDLAYRDMIELQNQANNNKMEKGGKLTESQQAKFDKIMKEWKAGKLHSGSPDGPIVKDQDQAIAIAYAEINSMKKMVRGGNIEEIKTKYQLAGSDKYGVYTYSKRVADEIANLYGGDVQEDGNKFYVRLDETYEGGKMNKMLFGGMINNLSYDAIDRMEGLAPNSELEELLNLAKYIILDMESEGFEKDEVMSFLAYKISQIGKSSLLYIESKEKEDEYALFKLYNELSKAKNIKSLKRGYDEDEGYFVKYESGLESESDYHKGELESYTFYVDENDNNAIEAVYDLSGNSVSSLTIKQALNASRANENVKMSTGGGVGEVIYQDKTIKVIKPFKGEPEEYKEFEVIANGETYHCDVFVNGNPPEKYESRLERVFRKLYPKIWKEYDEDYAYGGKMKTGGGVGDDKGMKMLNAYPKTEKVTNAYEKFKEYMFILNKGKSKYSSIMPYLNKNGVIIRYKHEDGNNISLITYMPVLELFTRKGSVSTNVRNLLPKEIRSDLNSYTTNYFLDSDHLELADNIKIINSKGELIKEFKNNSSSNKMAYGGGVGKMTGWKHKSK